MAAKTLVDFEDLYTAICEAIKVPTTDGVTLARIKRDINMIYLDHIIPFKPRAWWWLEKKQDVVTPTKITTGTVSLAAGGTTLTFSSASAVTLDLDEYYFKATGYPHIIKISAHTAASLTATLATPWPDLALSGAEFKLWKDHVSLDNDFKEVTQVTHDRRSTPLDGVNNLQFEERRARYPELEGYPVIINDGDFDSNGNRTCRWYPSCWDQKTILHVQGVQEATGLDADADEPLMPVEDRISIFYGAASFAWARERNESEATKHWNLFTMKLTAMAAKSGIQPQITRQQPDPDYTVNKRYRRLMRGKSAGGWRSSD